ncbi:DUF5684 domain-containing protein [Schumannella sp. 10F1B-5-1]|uniref:DUF5684 domain-containing protein n=1 Tax=Schumannella sp. 10F1B-5-1 TaxID=2590780 RepID=UPI00113228DB|nr:DUF5684 domain-containing protein [Schumannella sp. 10F1B-5-1]TPW76891.1 hypothetical protein FJ658_02890 [Schumannella sp. 10F1B-5-1]
MLHLAHDAVSTLLVTADSGDGGGGLISPLAQLGTSFVAYVLMAVAMWPVYRKAGFAGWVGFIPIVNLYLLLKIVKFHGALVLLYLIPLVNLIFALIVALRLGRTFGQGGVFSVLLLWLLAPIGQFIIGYGSAQHRDVDF